MNKRRRQEQGRSSYSAGVDDASMDYRTQQAINSATAAQHGVDLDDYPPGATANDGPYTEDKGPFEPDSSVQLANGTYVRTDEHGWPETDVNKDGVADQTTPAEAADATNQAAEDLENTRDMDVPPEFQAEKDLAIAEATKRAGEAIQHEIELGLQLFIAENPEATDAEIEAEANRLMHQILGREEVAGVISESQAEFRRDEAIKFATTGE